MSTTLTIQLDAEVLQSAEQEAKARHTTLPEVVAQQLRVMARNWQDSRAGRTPQPGHRQHRRVAMHRASRRMRISWSISRSTAVNSRA